MEWIDGKGGFQGWFYPSTRQRCEFGSTYKSSTRQVTRQEASVTRQVFRLTIGRTNFPLRVDALLHDDLYWQEHGNDDAPHHDRQEKNHDRFQQ